MVIVLALQAHRNSTTDIASYRDAAWLIRRQGLSKGLAERRAAQTRVAVARGYGEFWQGAGIDPEKLARYLPSLLDTADELKAVAGKFGGAPATFTSAAMPVKLW